MVLDGYLMTGMGPKDPGARAGRMQERKSFAGMFSESESCDRLLFQASVCMLSAYYY